MKRKIREGWKINDNDRSIFKRKILCMGSANGIIFWLRSLAVFWFYVLVFWISSENKSTQHHVCKLKIIYVQFWDKFNYKLVIMRLIGLFIFFFILIVTDFFLFQLLTHRFNLLMKKKNRGIYSAVKCKCRIFCAKLLNTMINDFKSKLEATFLRIFQFEFIILLRVAYFSISNPVIVI